MRRLITVWFLVTLALSISSRALLAQGVGGEGSIRGTVKDEQGAALPGVTITARTSAVATPFTTVTDGEGFYRLLNLAPGGYVVTAELQGFSKFVRDDVSMRAGLNLGVDIVLKIGTLSESLEVHGESPLLDVTKALQAVNVSAEFQDSLPLAARRHWSEFYRLAPGAVSSDSATDQASVFYIHGAGIVSFSTLIDGADMASAVNPWAGYVALPADTVSDVQIKTSGFDASTPLGFGAAANVVTQSGTNRLRGSATFAYNPKAWIGNNQPGGSSQTMSVTQPEMAVGGPIEPDRAWFFGSYRYRSGTLGISRAASDVAVLQAVDSSFQPFDNNIKANIYFIKANVQLNPKHQFSTFFNHDSTPYDSNSVYNAANYTKVVIGGSGYAARLNSAWSSWLTSQLSFSWNNKGAETNLVNTTATAQQLWRSVVPSAGTLVGTGQFGILNSAVSASQSPYTKWTITNDWTAYRNGWLGSHEFQVGVFLQPRMHRIDTIQYANGGLAEQDLVLTNANDPSAGLTLFKTVTYQAGSGVLSQGHFADNAFYVQDGWRPVPRLTVNLGVRVDHISRQDDLFNVQIEQATDIDPRVGAVFMLTADDRNQLRAAYMRVHDAASVNQQSAGGAGTQGSGSQTIGFTTCYSTKLNGIFDSCFVTPPASTTNPSRVIDPGYDQPYVDEFTAGYRRQLPGEVSVDLGYTHRNYKNRTALVDVNGIYTNGVFQGYKNPALNEIDLLTVDSWNWPVYDNVEIIATKRSKRLQAVASYTRVWPHMAGTWQPNDPASFIQPGAFPNNKGLQSNDNRSAAINNAYNYSTGAPEWAQHVARASASYHAPWDFELAGNYTLQTGRYAGPIFTKIGAPDPAFGPATLTLSNGRLVSNPLATTLRFAYPTIGDGQFELPAVHYQSVRVGRTFALGSDRKLTAALDILNILNLSGYQGFLAGANQLFSANYGRGGSVQPPRSYQLSFRYVF
jgi:outer membrane receptor protein involved in Fe transport